LKDWGTFLNVNLYREALLHLLPEKEGGVQAVDIFGQDNGQQDDSDLRITLSRR
jgi:hypothetical protein